MAVAERSLITNAIRRSQSHYFEARLADQFEAVIHFDETRALEPLERYSDWDSGEPPETYPTGV